MSRASTHRSGDVAYNGKHLYTVTGRVVAAASTQRFGHFVAPCDGRIVAALVNTVVTPTHATSDLSFGKVSDIDSHINEIDWQNHATGVVDLAALGSEGTDPYLDFDIVKGEVYAWGFVGGDTTGELVTTMVIEPS